MSRRTTALASILAVLLLGTAVWAWLNLAQKRAAAQSAAHDLAECYKTAARIEAFGKLPALASDRERMASETTGLISTAAKSAGIPADRLIRISPESPYRLGDSVYKEKPTQVLLKDVTLAQLVGLLHAASSAKQGLHPVSLRISAPRNDTGGNWTAEVVLSYLIYDPPSTPVTRSER